MNKNIFMVVAIAGALATGWAAHGLTEPVKLSNEVRQAPISVLEKSGWEPVKSYNWKSSRAIYCRLDWGYLVYCMGNGDQVIWTDEGVWVKWGDHEIVNSNSNNSVNINVNE